MQINNNNACPSDAWIPRLALVGSNVAFLLPCIYVTKLLYKRMQEIKIQHNLENNFFALDEFADQNYENKLSLDTILPKKSLNYLLFSEVATFSVDIVTLITLFFCSVFYHNCFDSYTCTRNCIAHYNQLQQADLTMAFMTLSLIVLWTLQSSSWWLKWVFFTINFIYVGIALTELSDIEFYLWYAFCLIVSLLFRTLIYRINFIDEIKSWNWIFAGLGIIFGALALYFQLSIGSLQFNQEPDQYWWKHSLWHLCLGIALFFRFCM